MPRQARRKSKTGIYHVKLKEHRGQPPVFCVFLPVLINTEALRRYVYEVGEGKADIRPRILLPQAVCFQVVP